jgi:peptidylprolyl isomerase
MGEDEMKQAKIGDTVRVHYSGFLEDGTIFDSSLERDPLEFKVGEGTLLKRFEDAVTGMKEGESKTVHIGFSDAYGPYHEDLVAVLDRSLLSFDSDPLPGMEAVIRTQDGIEMAGVIVAVTDQTVTIDSNHPLAGQDLLFEIKLLEIVN